MRTTRSLISSELAANIQVAVEDDNFKWILLELLSDIHRDGGQYTKLAGLQQSTEDAFYLLSQLRQELRSLKAKLRKYEGSQ